MVRERDRVLEAVNQALNAIELDDDVNFYDMMETAKQMYRRNRERREGGGTRQKGVTGAAANAMFKWDPEVQRLLASRDGRLTEYRDDLVERVARETESRTNAADAELRLAQHFIEIVHKREGARTERRYPWVVTMHGVDVVFQGQDVYALWVCLKQLLT